MKVMITGAGGQLGRDLIIHMQAAGYAVHGYDRRRLDITDEKRVFEAVRRLKPDAIVHAAAYTAVDEAEAQPEAAFRVNAAGTRNIAAAAEEVGAKLCYISTDYVFDGQKGSPYLEYDAPNPINVYGCSKYAGEELVRSLTRRWYIVRVSWLYGAQGKNFVKTMLDLAAEKQEIQVVDDQIGSPTYTVDAARFVSMLLSTSRYGIYHAANSGSCSWYEFAASIFALLNQDIPLIPIPTERYPRPAKRPRYSVLEAMAIRSEGFAPMRHWRDALKDYLREHAGRDGKVC